MTITELHDALIEAHAAGSDPDNTAKLAHLYFVEGLSSYQCAEHTDFDVSRTKGCLQRVAKALGFSMSDVLPKSKETYVTPAELEKLFISLKFPEEGIRVVKWMTSTKPFNSFFHSNGTAGLKKKKYIQEIANEMHRRKVYLTADPKCNAYKLDNIPVLEECADEP